MFEDKDQKFGGVERSYYPVTPKIIQWVMKYSGGLIEDEKQANYVLLGFVAAAITVSLILIFSGGGQEVSPEEIFRGTPSINE